MHPGVLTCEDNADKEVFKFVLNMVRIAVGRAYFLG
jgi:hypothetical protein